MKNPFYRNVQFIKENAPQYFKDLGYNVPAFEGSETDFIFGGNVWFQVTRPEQPDLIYTVLMRKQGQWLKMLEIRTINPEVKGFLGLKD